ncbi:MAG: hypothetical protein Q4D38_11335 [Planctomycetia bacterium]|nr:hypothetical protein [Planctomycetia bacterium]
MRIIPPTHRTTFWLVVFLLAEAALLGLAQESQAAEKYNRLAVLHGVYESSGNKNCHHDEFDIALKDLGWEAKKFASTKNDMDALMVALERNQYDIALVCPLFNYGENPIDMSVYGARFRKFVENGGALIVSDALYPGCLKWLTSIDPSLKITIQSCKAARDIENTHPVHPLRFLPNLVREGNTWGHLVLPAGHRWDTLARCSEGAPQVVMKRIGKGFVYICGPRIAGSVFLENFRTQLEMQRMGLSAEQFELPRFAIGDGRIAITLKTLDGVPKAEGRATLTLRASNGREKPVEFSQNFVVTPAQPLKLEVPYTISLRGEILITFALSGSGRNVRIFEKKITIPDLLTLSGPAYRGFAVESELRKKGGKILSTVEIAPLRENLEKMEFEIVAKSSSGQTIGTPAKGKVSSARFRQPLQIGVPPSGTYRIEGTLRENGRVLAKKTAELIVLRDAECQVYINEEKNLVVDGKEFFPIGIYHISPDDILKAAEIGFNTVQMFSWFGEQSLTEPAKYDMRVIYEQNHRSGDDWVGEKAVELAKKHSNILMWYGMDEPTEQTREKAKAIHEVYHKYDKRHPTFVVSYTPTLFPEQVDLGDVFAVDPYPYPRRPINMVSEWMEKAWNATKGEKPVICVPQSFGKESPEALRAMAYQAVVHEARGIIWYPWDDGGTTGLKHHPNLHPVMKTLVHEIKTLSPALLNKDGRVAFKSPNDGIHGLFCQEQSGKRYLILVNPQTTDETLELNSLEALQNAKELRGVFGTASANPKGSITLKSYQTCVFEIR